VVLAEMFREKRRRDQERRAQEERAQGQVEGRAEGRTEGRAQTQARWEYWLKRREEADRNNLPFNELPPSLEDFKNGSGV
jgi:predicted transposase YdaD